MLYTVNQKRIEIIRIGHLQITEIYNPTEKNLAMLH